jgi:hypothetical protein
MLPQTTNHKPQTTNLKSQKHKNKATSKSWWLFAFYLALLAYFILIDDAFGSCEGFSLVLQTTG